MACAIERNLLISPDMLTIPASKDRAVRQEISCLNWPDKFPYKPLVSFSAWHDGGTLHLSFAVSDQSGRAEEATAGKAGFRDSCVDFFIKPDAGDPHYYNFEWNAIGTLYLAWRTGRKDPENAPAEVLSKVKAVSSLGNTPFSERKEQTSWRLDIDIPAEALWHQGLSSWSGLHASANLYKCGDSLSVPHYVTWAPIATENPDYHRPEFFVPVDFE